MRKFPIPLSMASPLALFRDDTILKAHPDYRAPKAGSPTAAVRQVEALATPLFPEIAPRFSLGAIYAAPHAIEATGEN